MSIRQRTKFVPSTQGVMNPGQHPMKTWNLDRVLVRDQHITCDGFQFGRTSRLTETKVGTVYHPVDHENIVTFLGGGVPDWAADRAELYCTIRASLPDVVPVGLSICETDLPTRVLASAALNVFPEIGFRPNFQKYGWGHRFDGTSRKISTFKPSLNTGFSLVNFIIQWKDLKHIFDKYLRGPRGPKAKTKFDPELRNLIIQSRTEPGSSGFKAASAWLSHQYGTKQLFRDIFTVLKTLTEWKKNADKFLANVDTYKFISDRVAYLQYDNALVGQSPYSLLGVTGDSIVVLRHYVEGYLESNATLVYKYSVPKLPGFIARATQLLDAFGVSPDPSLIWDAIPYSFVLDWFMNFGEWFHRQRIDWNRAQFTFREFGQSARISITNTVWLEHIQVDGGDLYPPQLVCSVGTEEYVRELKKLEDVYLPPVINKEKWSLQRILNATALTAQKTLKGPTTVWWGGIRRSIFRTGVSHDAI